MSSYYSVNIPRCTHIKTNGTQCGSPAVRGRRFCFFHKNWHGERISLNAQLAALPDATFTLPLLEDADSIQVALMQVLRLIVSRQIEPKIAGLLLYGLQTASLNLCHTQLEPYNHESVVIDPGSVSETPLDEDPWNAGDFDDEETEDDDEEADDGEEVEDDSEDEEQEEAEAEEDTEPEEDAEPEEDSEADQASSLPNPPRKKSNLDKLRDEILRISGEALAGMNGEPPPHSSERKPSASERASPPPPLRSASE